MLTVGGTIRSKHMFVWFKESWTDATDATRGFLTRRPRTSFSAVRRVLTPCTGIPSRTGSGYGWNRRTLYTAASLSCQACSKPLYPIPHPCLVWRWFSHPSVRASQGPVIWLLFCLLELCGACLSGLWCLEQMPEMRHEDPLHSAASLRAVKLCLNLQILLHILVWKGKTSHTHHRDQLLFRLVRLTGLCMAGLCSLQQMLQLLTLWPYLSIFVCLVSSYLSSTPNISINSKLPPIPLIYSSILSSSLLSGPINSILFHL